MSRRKREATQAAAIPTLRDMLAQVILVEWYGPRLTLAQLGEALGLSESLVRKRVYEGKMPIPTYVDEKERWADARDVADYFNAMRQQAKTIAPWDVLPQSLRPSDGPP